MIPSALRKLRAFSRILVVRIILIAFLALFALVLAKGIGALIPWEFGGVISESAIDDILSIIASSMLAVTTFSLTVMAAAHRAVHSMWTPRAHRILLQDTTTHTVLATFVGAYLYALIAIVLRDIGMFDERERVVLFAMTVLVILLIVTAIIRWISHLETLGSLNDTSEQIEERTIKALKLRAENPCLGCAEYSDPPESARPIYARESGYIREIFQEELQNCAKKHDVRFWLPNPVGIFVYECQVLAWTDGDPDTLADAAHSYIRLARQRDFDQDPDFGLTSLSEIGVRALSPGVNDPGTAIEILHRIGRILMSCRAGTEDEKPRYNRLYLPPIDMEALVKDPILPILRDGADRLELIRPVRATLKALTDHPMNRIAKAAKEIQSEQ